jgi:DNA-binding CsgD family transcriptional regulator
MGRTGSDDGGPLLERERELAAFEAALDETDVDGSGRLILLEGPAGIGKTALLGALGARAAARGRRVLEAVGSEMERDFGFGVVRQLFGPVLRSLDPAARARLFAGPVALTAAIFGMAEPGVLDLTPTEASLYGLFWLVMGLAETGPLVLSIDDAHWADVASLRFIRYLAHRFDDLPALVVISARPNEPGMQVEALAGLRASLADPPIRPALLSGAGTAAIVRERIGVASSDAVEAACHEATGGNPLLIASLLAAPGVEGNGDRGPISPERIAALGSEQVGAGVFERAGRLDPHGSAVVRAAAVLGDGADLHALAALGEVDRGRGAAILDGLAAADILSADGERRFAHPLLRTAVYESIPPATRAEMHARAARLLREDGAEPEAVAAHLLLCEPGGDAAAIDVLEAAAERADERGAPESVVTYLGRALPEAADPARRGAVLHRLGRAGVAARDPASIEHLQEAARLTDNPALALDIHIEIADALALGGLWDGAMATIEAALERFAGSDLPGTLDLEAVRAAGRGYDPATARLYEEDLPRLGELVRGRTDDRSLHLRWVIAGLGACRDMPRAEITEMIGTDYRSWGFQQNGRESSLVAQAALALLMLDDLDAAEKVVGAFEEDARRRGSLLAMVSAVGYRASLDARRGQLQSSEEGLLAAVDLLSRNELSLMVLITFLHNCLDSIIERRGLESVAEIVEALEMPPAFGRTASGAMVLDVRGALRLACGDRPGARAALREVEASMGAMGFGPRFSAWRSRLALALDEAESAEALGLAEEELRLAQAAGSRRAETVALRTLGLLRGGEAGIELIRRSVELGRRGGSPLELARSLAELGAALRRGNQRREARECLREAFDLAQRCGAERLEDRLEEELRVAGAKPRRRAVSGPDSLTPSERRVAGAAAAGATNREIGQMLFVSIRTVEMHLTNTYAKLGISARTDLVVALAPPL